jgi:hypothetical protein
VLRDGIAVAWTRGLTTDIHRLSTSKPDYSCNLRKSMMQAAKRRLEATDRPGILPRYEVMITSAS